MAGLRLLVPEFQHAGPSVETSTYLLNGLHLEVPEISEPYPFDRNVPMGQAAEPPGPTDATL
jgi:hypothetical protein